MNEDSSTDEVGEKPQKKKKTDGSKIPTRVIIAHWSRET